MAKRRQPVRAAVGYDSGEYAKVQGRPRQNAAPTARRSAPPPAAGVRRQSPARAGNGTAQARQEAYEQPVKKKKVRHFYDYSLLFCIIFLLSLIHI